VRLAARESRARSAASNDRARTSTVVTIASRCVFSITSGRTNSYGRIEMHRSPESFEVGSAIVTDPISRIAVRQTSVLL
jgi:hypothetical protein